FPVPPGMVEIEYNSILAQWEADRARRQEPDAADPTGEVPGPAEPDAASVVAPEETAPAGTADTAPPSPEAPPPRRRGRTRRAPEAAASADAPLAAGASATAAQSAPGEDEEKEKAEFRQIAERRVRLGLLLAEVGRNNNITVTQEELNQALAMEARRLP